MQVIEPVVPINPPGTGKDFATVQARFALVGAELSIGEYEPGCVGYSVKAYGVERIKLYWGDVIALLRRWEGCHE